MFVPWGELRPLKRGPHGAACFWKLTPSWSIFWINRRQLLGPLMRPKAYDWGVLDMALVGGLRTVNERAKHYWMTLDPDA